MGHVRALSAFAPSRMTGWTLVLVLAGCTSHELPTAAGATAAVDADTGTVTLPFDRYWPTLEDTNRLATALDVVVARCMDEAGEPHEPASTEVLPAYQSTARYGVWRMVDARQRGYEPPGVAAKGAELSAAQQKAYDACLQSPETSGLHQTDYFTPQTMRTYQYMRLPPLSTVDEAMRAIDKWRSCMTEAGYVPPRRTVAGADLDWIPADLDRMTVEEQLKTAVADVRCKDKLGLVQELANLDADRQQKMIDEHKTDLEAFRQVWLPMRAAADKVLGAR